MNYGFDVPLKKPLPFLKYDMALYCENLKKRIIVEPPEYLRDYKKKINECINKYLCSKPSEPVDAFRIYIVDYRLNVLFAGLDTTGEIATFFSKFGKRGNEVEDWYCGDGEVIGGAVVFDGSNGFIYDKKSIKKFSDEYKFVPLEELSSAAVAIFDDDGLAEYLMLSQLQTTLLLQRYSCENLVDFKKLYSTMDDVADNVTKIYL